MAQPPPDLAYGIPFIAVSAVQDALLFLGRHRESEEVGGWGGAPWHVAIFGPLESWRPVKSRQLTRQN
jgi:hypothetical protein